MRRAQTHCALAAVHPGKLLGDPPLAHGIVEAIGSIGAPAQLPALATRRAHQSSFLHAMDGAPAIRCANTPSGRLAVMQTASYGTIAVVNDHEGAGVTGASVTTVHASVSSATLR